MMQMHANEAKSKEMPWDSTRESVIVPMRRREG